MILIVYNFRFIIAKRISRSKISHILDLSWIQIKTSQIWFTCFCFSWAGYHFRFYQYIFWVLLRSSFQFQSHHQDPRFLWVIFCVRTVSQVFQFIYYTVVYLDPREHWFSAFVHSLIDSLPSRTQGKVLTCSILDAIGLTRFLGFDFVFHQKVILTFRRVWIKSEDLWLFSWIDSFIQAI